MGSNYESQTMPAEHETLVFELDLPKSAEKVWAAFAIADLRSTPGAPSKTTVVIYIEENFSEGGQDRYRCGSKENP